VTSALRVVRARLYEVTLPLREPFAISGGVMAIRRSLVVELEDADGARGYGESAPFDAPFYSAETVASARACLTEWLLPRVLAQPVTHAAELDALLTRGIVGNEMARAGVETAWWDLRASREGVSLAELVARRLRELEVPEAWLVRRDQVTCGLALGIPHERDPERLALAVASGVERGYRRVKVKIGPGWDVTPLRAVRDALASCGATIPVTADANGAYELPRDADALARVDAFDLLYLEQPLPGDALWDLRQLGRRLRTPVCLDESLTSERVARQIVELQGPAVWNLKVQRVGGLESACRVYATAAAAAVKLWLGTMPETGLGAQAGLALGCHAGFVYPSDLEPSERWYPAGTDLIELVMRGDGTMAVPGRRAEPALSERARLVHEAVGG
jgi:O-succinylbenzoate synthase